MTIGVFDSGIGGQAIADQLRTLIPNADIKAVDDRKNVPYGSRPADEIIALTDRAIQPILNKCDVIVIACNTATTVAIDTLRSKYPKTKFVGIEPMIKPAAFQTQTGRITVLATPATLKSGRYKQLKELWAKTLYVDEPDCSTWARTIEDGQADLVPIEETVQKAVSEGSDVIVLACTHYHWLKERADKTAGDDVVVLEPSDAIARRINDIAGPIAN